MRPVRLPPQLERRLRRIELALEELGIDLDDVETANSPGVLHGMPATWQQSQHVGKEFGLPVGWYGRGASGEARRRSELRALATREVDAAGKKAKLAIERRTAEVLTALVAGTLESADARRFLVESIPMPDALMPTIAVASLEAGDL